MIINRNLVLPDAEIELKAVRSQGAGGQNVNKVSSAIHLRYDINKSSLPSDVKARLLALADQRISKEGIVVIKAQIFRTQEQNRREALERLKQLIISVCRFQRRRIPTKPGRGVVRRRLDNKQKKGRQKTLRKRVTDF